MPRVVPEQAPHVGTHAGANAHHDHRGQAPYLAQGLPPVDGSGVAHHTAGNDGPVDGKDEAGHVREDVGPGTGEQQHAGQRANGGSAHEHDLSTLGFDARDPDHLVGDLTHDRHREDAHQSDQGINVRGLLEVEPYVLGPITHDLGPDEKFAHHAGEESEDDSPYGVFGKGFRSGPFLLHHDRDSGGGGAGAKGLYAVPLRGLLGHEYGHRQGDEQDDAQEGQSGGAMHAPAPQGHP